MFCFFLNKKNGSSMSGFIATRSPRGRCVRIEVFISSFFYLKISSRGEATANETKKIRLIDLRSHRRYQRNPTQPNTTPSFPRFLSHPNPILPIPPVSQLCIPKLTSSLPNSRPAMCNKKAISSIFSRFTNQMEEGKNVKARYAR